MTTIRTKRALAASAIALSLLTTACGGGGEGGGSGEFESMTLSLTSWVGEDLGHSLAIKDFISAVEERTGGAVQIDTFWNASLCSSADTMECIGSGTADIGFTSAIFHTAEMPASTVGSIPFQTSNTQGVTDALNAMYAENDAFRAEWDATNQHLLWFKSGSLPLLGTTSPIESVSDLAGKSIRTVGYPVRSFDALGANVVATAPAEQYEALERGVIDGTLYTTDGFVDSRLYEVVNHLYDLGEYMGNYVAMYTAMNQDVWDGMSPELQAVFTEEAARVAAVHHQDYMGPYDVEACQTLAANVDDIRALGDVPAAEAWAAEQKDASLAAWMSDVEGVGFADGQAVWEDFIGRVEAAEVPAGYQTSGQVCIEAAAR